MPTAAPAFSTLAEVVHAFQPRGRQEAVRFFNGFRVFRYSYAELYDWACRCAAFFDERGVQRGDRVMIWAPNGPEWAAVFCACAVSGVILVPLDIRNTEEFVRLIAAETEAKLLIRTQYKKDPGVAAETVLYESLFNHLLQTAPAVDLPMQQPDDVVEIVYTSGTTGTPKGVVLTQRNLASNLADILEIVSVDETYHLLSVLPLSHALEQTAGFWTPLAGGGTVTYIRALKPSTLFEVFQRVPITAMVLVPRLLYLLKIGIEKQLREKKMGGYLKLGLALYPSAPRWLRKLYFFPIHKRFNKNFHIFVSGGSALDSEVEKFWNALGFEVLQGYGLTETSPVLSATRPGHTRISSVGPAAPSVQLRLAADREIQAKGPNIFPGYYKRPDLTEGVFEDGWFKTGDVGEFDPDGYLYIRSRKKDIIVTGDGVNVYPEDIEGELSRLPQIKESCVLGVGDKEEEIHAVVILNDPQADLNQLIDQANQKLSPEQKVQSYSLWPGDEFPKTTTLKIKKNEVRKNLQRDGSTAAPKGAEEGTRFQKTLAEVAELPVADLKPEAQLGQDLGLSSIKRVELVTKLEEAFRLDVDESAVLAETTVGQLQNYIENYQGQQLDLVFRRWTRSAPVQAIRSAFERLILFPLTRAMCDLEITGLENVQNLTGPVFIVANHTSHVDTALAKMLMPRPIGRKVCPAAWKEYFDAKGRPMSIRIAKWLAWNFSTVFINIFPFPQTTGFRKSMAYAGELLDDGWSILLFPEGERSRTGDLLTFRDGVGVMLDNFMLPYDNPLMRNGLQENVAEADSLIETRRLLCVPMAIAGGEQILHPGTGLPRRGKLRIAIGQPFYPSPVSYAAIALQVKQEISNLHDKLKKMKV